MEAKLKVSCWCCEKCVSSRRQKVRQSGDDQEVFLPLSSMIESESNSESTGSIKTDSSRISNQTSPQCGFGRSDGFNLDMSINTSVLVGNNKGSKGSSDGFYDVSPLDHLYQVLNYHPKYITVFLDTHNFLLRGIGPIPYDQRCYIGIMAAARHHCSYLVKSLATSFLACGGDERWLGGLEHIPQKLRNLCEVNRILAHRPWLLSKHHIKILNQGADTWSISELTHALVLMAHFHSLASFVFACGITLEAEQKQNICHSSSGSTSDQGPFDIGGSDSDAEIDRILEQMKILSTETENEVSQEELRKRFDKIESQATKLKTKKKEIKSLDLLQFVEDPEFLFIDFANRDPDLGITPFDVREFAWEDSGSGFMNWLNWDMTNLLDSKFTEAQEMTYYKMGHKQNVDTFTFRRAIWNYIHCLLGMFHDDYNYEEIDHLLENNLKWYIKAATCTPETIVYKNYCSFMKEFLDSEKVHIGIMVLEARLQAELLYSLRAIARHMT